MQDLKKNLMKFIECVRTNDLQNAEEILNEALLVKLAEKKKKATVQAEEDLDINTEELEVKPKKVAKKKVAKKCEKDDEACEAEVKKPVAKKTVKKSK